MLLRSACLRPLFLLSPSDMIVALAHLGPWRHFALRLGSFAPDSKWLPGARSWRDNEVEPLNPKGSRVFFRFFFSFLRILHGFGFRV